MTEEQKKFTDPIPEENSNVVKKSKKKNWIFASIGLLFIILGSLSVFQTEEMNNLAVQIGSKTVTTEMVEAYPGYEHIWLKVATVIDSAIEARTSSPDSLALLINEEMDKLMESNTPEIAGIVEKVVEQINLSWKSSENEEIYIEKLKSLSEGIKQALN